MPIDINELVIEEKQCAKQLWSSPKLQKDYTEWSLIASYKIYFSSTHASKSNKKHLQEFQNGDLGKLNINMAVITEQSKTRTELQLIVNSDQHSLHWELNR